jgi:hypothetical protein
MVKRKCLTLVLLVHYFYKPASAYSSAWLHKPGTWAFYYNNEQSLNLNSSVKKIKRKINESHEKIGGLIQEIEKKKAEIDKNTKLTPEAKTNRINYLNQVRERLLDEFNQLYISYPRTSSSTLIEYGAYDYLTIGARLYKEESSLPQGEKITQKGLDTFTRVKLMQDKKYVLSVQPKISFLQTNSHEKPIVSTEARVLLGINRKIKKYNIVHFNNFEFAYKVSNFEPKEIFIGEITEGFRFKNGMYLLLQSFIENRSTKIRVFKSTAKGQFSIAKEFNFSRNFFKTRNQTKLTAQVGYFYNKSLSERIKLGEGVFFSLWLVI